MRLLTATFLWLAFATLADAAVSDKYLVDWVEKRATTIAAKVGQRPFDKIGWASDIRHAFTVAQEHGRPVFLFNHDGQIHIGRC